MVDWWSQIPDAVGLSAVCGSGFATTPTVRSGWTDSATVVIILNQQQCERRYRQDGSAQRPTIPTLGNQTRHSTNPRLQHSHAQARSPQEQASLPKYGFDRIRYVHTARIPSCSSVIAHHATAWQASVLQACKSQTVSNIYLLQIDVVDPLDQDGCLFGPLLFFAAAACEQKCGTVDHI
jgi:hypothetical protein